MKPEYSKMSACTPTTLSILLSLVVFFAASLAILR